METGIPCVHSIGRTASKYNEVKIRQRFQLLILSGPPLLDRLEQDRQDTCSLCRRCEGLPVRLLSPSLKPNRFQLSTTTMESKSYMGIRRLLHLPAPSRACEGWPTANSLLLLSKLNGGTQAQNRRTKRSSLQSAHRPRHHHHPHGTLT